MVIRALRPAQEVIGKPAEAEVPNPKGSCNWDSLIEECNAAAQRSGLTEEKSAKIREAAKRQVYGNRR